MLHFTMTGPYAGATLCGTQRNEVDEYAHPRVDFTEDFYQTHNVCPECRRVWEDAEEE